MTEDFFVGVRNPKDVRRELVTSSRSLVEALIKYEKYKGLREQKLQTLEELKSTMDELVVLNRKLRGRLPKVKRKKMESIPHECPETGSKKKIGKKTTAKKKEVKKKPPVKSRLDKLREKIEEYESKISTLQ
ncbi:hypothetical protein GF342_05155 [Candidatus Woesearchaeota archaeon]|nr:hypothetical protein [Candidatus Woesearchaeota archaeon]